MEFHLLLIQEFEKYEKKLTNVEKEIFIRAGFENIEGFLFTMGNYVREKIILKTDILHGFSLGGVKDLVKMSEIFLQLFYIYLRSRWLLDQYPTYYI